MRSRNSVQKRIFEGQLIHILVLLVCLVGVNISMAMPGAVAGHFISVSTRYWIWLAVVNAIAHQVYVWFFWRIELHAGMLTKWFGPPAFTYFSVGFVIFFILRPILAFCLGWANKGTLPLNEWLSYGATVICFIGASYTMHSIKVHFSFKRAFGIDHFDENYRKLPFVREGVFRLSPNAMYLFGFLALWIPVFLFQSQAALIAAVFSHVYIWVHYVTTEKPDMDHIYGT